VARAADFALCRDLLPAAAGADQRRLILGFRNVIGDLPMSNGQTLAQMHPSLKTIYDFLWLIGEAIFFYLPVGICWSAVKKMGGTPILGIVLGVTLVSPQLMNAYLLASRCRRCGTSACLPLPKSATRRRSSRPCWRVWRWALLKRA
jgi:PTS system trehalose-specific IIC component